MKLSGFVAKRYLFSKSKRNAINVISWISVAAIAVVTAAMFVVLSGFNGLEGLITGMFTAMDPDLKIEQKDGQYFKLEAELENQLKELKIVDYSKVIEGRCLFKSNAIIELGVLKGVDSNYLKVSKMPKKLFDGRFVDFKSEFASIVLGEHLRSKLQVGVGNTYSQIEAWLPKAKKSTSIDLRKSFRSQKFMVSGSFLINEDYDKTYGFTSYQQAQTLLNKTGFVSALELKIPENLDIETIEKTLENNLINSDLEVKNIREQHSDVLSFVELERWFIIFIFILIILLAAFNLIGSLSIIIIDKKDNLKTLHHLGLSRKKIQQIFWNLNYQMNALGVGIGLSLGILICVLQQEFQLIRIAPSLAYPVKMQFTDGLMICLIVAILSSICAFFSIRKIKTSNL